MPIKGFSSLEEQNKYDAVEMYGIPWTYTGSNKNKALHPTKRILPKTKIPYICDETGKEFMVMWGSFGTQCETMFKKPRYYKQTRQAVVEEQNRLTVKEKFALLIKEWETYPSSIKEEFIKISNDTLHGCSHCCKNLPLKFFRTSKKATHNLSGWCKVCDREKANKDHAEKQKDPNNHIPMTAKTLCTSTKTRAKEKGWEHKLTRQDIEKMFVSECPILGHKLEFFKGAFYPYSPSIDRLDSSKGYTLENCRVISFRANELKSSSNIDQMKKIIEYIKFGTTNFDIKINEPRYDKHTLSSLLYACQCRAKKKGIEFSITRDDIIPLFGRYCPIFGYEYVFHQSHPQFTSASIDRYDNGKGYTPENIRVISHHANTIKGKGTLEEFEKILKYMEENLPHESSQNSP